MKTKAGRPGPPSPRVVLLTTEERSELARLLRCGTTEHRMAERARIVLLRADGQSVSEIARVVGREPRTVQRRLDAFLRRRMEALKDRKRSGRPRKLSLFGNSSS